MHVTVIGADNMARAQWPRLDRRARSVAARGTNGPAEPRARGSIADGGRCFALDWLAIAELDALRQGIEFAQRWAILARGRVR